MRSSASFDKLFVDQLKDMYNAEKQIVRALPKMARAAHSPELRSALEEHLEITQEQVSRLEEVFETMGHRAAGKTCKGMQGLIEEGQEIVEEDLAPDVRDAGMIAAAQKVEHYEIAAYGTLRTLAQMKGDQRVAELLQQTLDEEYEADKRLTRLAESSVNEKAIEESDD